MFLFCSYGESFDRADDPGAAGGARLLAIRHLGQAVAAWYALDAGNVLDDAARFAGERALSDVPWEMHKPVVDYLCGRLLLPERRATSI